MDQQSVLLFTLGTSKEGSPTAISPASFQKMGALEVQDIERWIKEQPTLLGEEFLVIANQFMQWDKTKDRLDLLVLDRRGKLGVVEIKRDQSGSTQDLQAIRYAAYASTLSVDQVVDLFMQHCSKEGEGPLAESDARQRLADFATEGNIEAIDENDRPRVILVAGTFQPGVTGTAVWLRQSFGMDVSCVQVQPYELQGEIVLTSTTIVPVPEAADFEVKVRAKKQKVEAKSSKPLDFEVAAQFIESIPVGRWSSYGDVAVAAGSPQGAMGLGSWLRSNGDSISNVHRVLNFRGEVSDGWKASAPDLPPNPAAVRAKLEDEGVPFDQNDRAAKDRRWAGDEWLGPNPSAHSLSEG